jgi:hypothetical protein
MKHPFLKLVWILAAVSLACTVSFDLPASRTGDTQTMTVNESAPSGDPARLDIEMGGGELNITGGGSGLVSGTIEYNIADWEPTIERSGDTVRIAQEVESVPIPDNGNLINRWELRLGNTPMFLTVQAGAYEGTINLSGVPLTGFEITGGASDSEIRFDSPNPENMDTFDLETGASNVEVYGLGNANVSVVTITSGAGDYVIDFGGELQRSMMADITGAVGELRIVVPSGTLAEVNVTGGLRDIDLQGEWTKAEDGDIYSTSGSGPQLSIDVEMSVGNLELVSE